MRILGIDPGYAILGYGVVDVSGTKLTPVDYGVIETTPDERLPERLNRLYDGTCALIEKFHPDMAVFEELFFYRNTTTALAVGAGRGVAILAAQRANIPLYEYTPMQIKQGITGYGKADKKQVQQMVALILRLSGIPKPDDAADAVAAAITHLNTGPGKIQFRMK